MKLISMHVNVDMMHGIDNIKTETEVYVHFLQ
jgi:hypothetical protein